MFFFDLKKTIEKTKNDIFKNSLLSKKLCTSKYLLLEKMYSEHKKYILPSLLESKKVNMNNYYQLNMKKS